MLPRRLLPLGLSLAMLTAAACSSGGSKSSGTSTTDSSASTTSIDSGTVTIESTPASDQLSVTTATTAAQSQSQSTTTAKATTTTVRTTTTKAATTATTPRATTTAKPVTTTGATSACSVTAQSPPITTTNATTATALAFAPDGRLFFAERAGTVKVVQNGAVKQFATVATITTEPGGGSSERGLLGLAVSPTFTTDRFVYAFYSDTDHTHQKVVRWTDCAGTGTNATDIISVPSGSDCCHKGGRIKFGTDGKLYVTLGDTHVSAAAQDTNDMRGKVLRYNADGTVPADNPFGAGNPVWAFGFRNPFGLAISPSGQMAVTNNGPSGDAGAPGTGYDTVVTSVVKGGGYEWPRCYGYSHVLAPATSCGSGQHEPDWSSESSTVVPTGGTFVDSQGPSGTAGHLVFCSYSDGMLILTPGSPHATITQGPTNCLLDVVQAPDHTLYFSDNAHIYRLA